MKKNGKIKQLLGALVLALCFCFYSNPLEAYTQQFQVGDTGPNGGTVQSVDVTSTVTGTEVQLNGGFEETTTTTLYTETVIEQISTTETTTTTTTTTQETTTTNSLPGINSSDWSSTGSVSFQNQPCSYSGGTASGQACTGPQNNTSNSMVTTSNKQNWNVGTTGGGQIVSEYVEMAQDLTEAELQAGFTLNYGVSVESHNSNTTVPWCSKTNGDCNDRFRVTVRLYNADPNSNANSLVHTINQYETLNYSNTRNYNYTEDIAANTYTELWGQMELWGQDSGYHSGMFGPIFSNPYMTLTYDAITTITETITNIVLSTQETVYNTSEDVLTKVYIGDPVQDTITVEPIDYTEVDSFEIEIVNEDTGGGIEMEFTVEIDETSNVATVEMNSTNLDTGVVQVETIAEISLDFDMDTGGTDVSEITVAEIEADIGSQIDSAVASIDIEVNTNEGGLSENASTEPEVSETEVGTDTSSTEQTESLQESSSDVEQPVGEDNSESSSESSGDTGSEGDSNRSEAESETDSNGTSESSQKDGDSTRGDDAGGEEKDAGRSEGKSKTKTKTKSKSEERKAEKVKLELAKAKQKIANRILSAMADTYSAINEATKIALISSLADTENFKKYVQKQNEDAMDWYSDEQVYRNQQMLGDPYGALFGSAQDNLMNEMINEQYKPGYGLGLQ